MPDPNPKVAGRGFRQLRRAGVNLTLGERQSEARRLNEQFANWIRSGLPLVILKSALTLDGYIASLPRSGKNGRWITSLQSRDEVQLLRHSSDALVTGIGTVLADNPSLTDRTGRPRRRPLLRVILDSRLRLPLTSKLVKSADRDVLVFTTQPLESSRARVSAARRNRGGSSSPAGQSRSLRRCAQRTRPPPNSQRPRRSRIENKWCCPRSRNCG